MHALRAFLGRELRQRGLRLVRERPRAAARALHDPAKRHVVRGDDVAFAALWVSALVARRLLQQNFEFSHPEAFRTPTMRPTAQGSV